MNAPRFPADQTATMRAEIDALVEAWIDRGWSMEGASATLIGYGMHMLKAGKWKSLDEVITSIRAAWPLMKEKP